MNMGGRHQACLISVCSKETMNIFLRDIRGTVSAELWDACGGSMTRKEADSLTEEKKTDMLEYLRNLPVYKIVTVGGREYFLTHSGYNADYDMFRTETV